MLSSGKRACQENIFPKKYTEFLWIMTKRTAENPF
jgi:hypothetical protein